MLQLKKAAKKEMMQNQRHTNTHNNCNNRMLQIYNGSVNTTEMSTQRKSARPLGGLDLPTWFE